MEKFVPFEKLSKKEQKKLNSAKRNDWKGLNPVTRVADKSDKKYSRKEKHKKDYRPGSSDGNFLFAYKFIKCVNVDSCR